MDTCHPAPLLRGPWSFLGAPIMAATMFVVLTFLSFFMNVLKRDRIPLTNRNDNLLVHQQGNQIATDRHVEYAFAARLQRSTLKLTKSSRLHRTHKAHRKYSKHDDVSLLIPGHNPPTDIAIFKDILKNPGPSQSNRSNFRLNFGGNIESPNQHINDSPTITYSRSQLLSIRTTPSARCKISPTAYSQLKMNGLFRFRGKRAGRKKTHNRDPRIVIQSALLFPESVNNGPSSGDSSYNLHNSVNSSRDNNNASPRRRPSISSSTPTLPVSNVQSLLNKVDELESVVHNNNVDVVCITETWLSDEIPDSAVAMNNFILFRNDRSSHAGGVGIYVNCKISCKQLPEYQLSGSITVTLASITTRKTPSKEISHPPWHRLSSFIIHLVPTLPIITICTVMSNPLSILFYAHIPTALFGLLVISILTRPISRIAILNVLLDLLKLSRFSHVTQAY